MALEKRVCVMIHLVDETRIPLYAEKRTLRLDH